MSEFGTKEFVEVILKRLETLENNHKESNENLIRHIEASTEKIEDRIVKNIDKIDNKVEKIDDAVVKNQTVIAKLLERTNFHKKVIYTILGLTSVAGSVAAYDPIKNVIVSDNKTNSAQE